MYESFYGLQERPFDLTTDPRFLFMTAGHREALSTIQYGITERKGITLLAGPAGTGKTSLAQAALRMLEGVNVRVIHLSNPTLTRDEFFQFLCLELNLTSAAAASKTHFLRELDAVLRQRHAAGLVTALIIDEAQALSDELLEEVRLLANSDTSTDQLFPVVLIGQPELSVRLNQPRLQQLKQRVALRATTAPLTLRETGDYVAERLRIAGGDIRTVFTPEAVAAIFECSGGIPRTINVVCDNALVSGFALDQRPVGRSVIAEVSRDFDLPAPRGSATERPGTLAPVAVLRPSAAPVDSEAERMLQPAMVVPIRRTSLGPPAMENRTKAARSEIAPRWGLRSLFVRTATR